MDHVTELNLVDVSWPISLLQSSKQVDMMAPGEQLIISLGNADTVDSLVSLLKTMSNVEYAIRRTDECFLLTILKHPKA